MFNKLSVAVDRRDNTLYVNREQWEELPSFMQQKLINDLEEEHGTKLTLRLIDGDPHDDNNTGGEQIEVDNLLIPDNVRVALCHYPDGVVSVTRVRTGWTWVEENGDHECHMKVPYDPNRVPDAITILSYLPKEGLKAGGRSATGPRFPTGENPVFLDLSDKATEVKMPEPTGLEARLTKKVEELKAESVGVDGSADSAMQTLNHMVAGTKAIIEIAESDGESFERVYMRRSGFLRTALALFMVDCGEADEENPEADWLHFNKSVETLMRRPWEFFREDTLELRVAREEWERASRSAEGSTSLERLMGMFQEMDDAKVVNLGIREGRPFSEWREAFHLHRIRVVLAISQAFASVAE